MSDVLEHHGILGQKWGVRRTPAELGHVTGGKKSGSSDNKSSGAKPATKETGVKTPGKTSRKSSSMTDEELRQRINRLNMEEQYDNLVARQKQRNTGTVKKLLGEAAESLGRKALGLAVDKFIDKLGNKEGKFDIDDWKNSDVDEMDADTIQKVAKWYQNAQSIRKGREALTAKPSTSSEGKEKNKSSNQKTESPKVSSNAASTADSSTRSDVSARVPWMYRKAGTADKKDKERIERERRKRDKDQYKWIG